MKIKVEKTPSTALTVTFIAVLTIFFIYGWNSSSAALISRTWDGEGLTNNWSEPANWSGNTVPQTGDIAVFDGTNSKNATIDAAFTVSGIQIGSGYAGTITHAPGNALVVNGNLIQNGGAFTGSTADIDINGQLDITGGTFTASNGTTFVEKLTRSVSGAFQHNSGTVVLDGNTSVDHSLGGITFNNLTFDKTGGASSFPNGTLTVLGLLVLNDGAVEFGNINAQGNVVVASTFDGGHTSLSFTGTSDQTFTDNGGTNLTGVWTIDKHNASNIPAGQVILNSHLTLPATQYLNIVSGTLDQGPFNVTVNELRLETNGTYIGSSNNIDVNGHLRINGGNFTASNNTSFIERLTVIGGGVFQHNGGTVVLDGGTSSDHSLDGVTFNNLILNKIGGATSYLSGTAPNVDGTLTFRDGLITYGTIAARQDVVIESTFDGVDTSFGTFGLTFDGSGNQSFTNNSGHPPTTGAWIINKSNNSVLNAISSVNLGTNTNQTLTITNGTLYLNNGSDLTAFTVTIASGGQFVSDTASTITLSGTLTNNGKVALQGGGAGCPDNDTILIRSSVDGTRRNWNGIGQFRLVDVDVRDMGGTAPITVFSGTDSGNNNANWTFDGNCPTALSISPTVVSRYVNQTQTFSSGGGFTPRTYSIPVNNSGATINPTTGLYTAGTTFNVSDTVRVTDAFGATADATVSVSAGPPTRLAFVIQPTNAVAGQSISPFVQIAIQDNSGNIVTSANDPVTISISNNSGGSTLSGTLTQNAVGGIATFNDLSLNRSGTGYTLAATSGSLTSSTSGAFDITFAAAAQLAFTTNPTDAPPNAVIVPPIQVEVQDQFGNLVNNASNQVNISIGVNPSGGMLSGTLLANAAGGIATFSDLRIDLNGAGYTLNADSSGLATAVSKPFSILSPFVVTNTNGSGPGSLRAAITNANSTSGTQTISFDIPARGHSLSLR